MKLRENISRTNTEYCIIVNLPTNKRLRKIQIKENEKITSSHKSIWTHRINLHCNTIFLASYKKKAKKKKKKKQQNNNKQTNNESHYTCILSVIQNTIKRNTVYLQYNLPCTQNNH